MGWHVAGLTDTGTLMSAHDAPDLYQFQTPSVRHLVWLCQAPQLVRHPGVFHPAAYLPHDYLAILKAWDNHPATRPDLLNTTPHYRLGYYFETLYACLIQDLLGWTILARNLPVRANGLTLGELDFLILNPHTNVVEHHEIAVKFYLGYDGDADLTPGWYGPNPRDRLDIKTARMLEQQSQRGLMPETSGVLAQLGIPQPEVSRVFMPGYLFYPQVLTPEATAQVPAPATLANVPTHHLRGHWIYLDKLTETDTSAWIPLIKPHWLGPAIQPHKPDNIELTQALADIKNTRAPRLFAVLQHDDISGLWNETDRVFVVPECWPRPA